jgi:hypothetical protein
LIQHSASHHSSVETHVSRIRRQDATFGSGD